MSVITIVIGVRRGTQHIVLLHDGPVQGAARAFRPSTECRPSEAHSALCAWPARVVHHAPNAPRTRRAPRAMHAACAAAAR